MSASVVRPSLNDPTRPRENAGGRGGEVRRARGLEADCSARVHDKRQRNRRERPINGTCSTLTNFVMCKRFNTSTIERSMRQPARRSADGPYTAPNTARARAAYTAGVLSMGTMLSQYGRQGWSHVVDFQLVGSRAPYSFRGPVWTQPSHTSYLIIRVTPVEDPRSCSYTSTTNSPPAWYDVRS